MLDHNSLAALREKALAATPEKWTWHPTGLVRDSMASLSILASHNHTPYVDRKDAEYICAANPQAVIALLDEIERLREELGEAEHRIQYLLDDGECHLYRSQAQEFLDNQKRKSP